MTQAEILELLEREPGLTSAEISQVIGCGLSSTRRCLNVMNKYEEVFYIARDKRGWGIKCAWRWFKT
jgi:DNA-binding IclR family transcriptional regulator